MTDRQSVDLDTVVVSATAAFCRAGGTTIDGSGVEPTRVHGDAVALGRLVHNLVDNAVRYAGSKVAVSVFQRGSSVRLTVVDDGPGIPAEAWDRIFERGVRLDDAPDHEGVGLADAREIVGIHNAKVFVEPSARGARFVVDFPGD